MVKAREPIVVLPAGPMLDKPRPAKLGGPQVVRVKAPGPPDRPRPRFKPRYDAPVTQPLMYKNKDAGAATRRLSLRCGGKKRENRATKDHAHGRRKEKDEEEAKRDKLQKN